MALHSSFFAADGADFSFEGDASVLADLSKLSGLFEVLFEGKRGTVEHDGGEPCIDASLGSFIVTVVEVKGDGDRDAHGVDEVVDHVDDELVAAHVLGCAHGSLDDNGGIGLLGTLQDGLGPFQVVDVESADAVSAFAGSDHHISSGNCHNILLMARVPVSTGQLLCFFVQQFSHRNALKARESPKKWAIHINLSKGLSGPRCFDDCTYKA